MFGGEKVGQDKFDKLKEVLGWLETFVAEDKFSAGTDCLTLGDLALLATYSTMKVGTILGTTPTQSQSHKVTECFIMRHYALL